MAANPNRCPVGCGRLWVPQLSFYSSCAKDAGPQAWAMRVYRLTVHSDSRLLNLFDLWHGTISFSATDPRDKIYALLGPAKDEDRAAIAPDYRIGIKELQSRLTEYLIASRFSLRCGLGNRLRTFHQSPSWLPLMYLSTNLPENSGPANLFISPSNVKINACGHSDPTVRFCEVRKVLGVKGFVFDFVDYHTPPIRCIKDLLGERKRKSQPLLQEMLCMALDAMNMDIPGLNQEMCPHAVVALWKCLIADHHHALSDYDSELKHQLLVLTGHEQVPQDEEPAKPLEEQELLLF